MATIAVDIMTPERLVMQTEAESIVIPAAEGELGILPHHAPLLAELQPGEIRLRRGGNVELFAVSGGFIEVVNNHVSIFAETAEMAHEIDAERARQAAERAKAEIKAARTDIDLAQAEAALRRAMARLRVTEGLRRGHQPSYR
jgi:F-type H+-transporting ATPase subunit epsilon